MRLTMRAMLRLPLATVLGSQLITAAYAGGGITLSPSALTFSNVAIGTAATPQFVTLTNGSATSASISLIAVADPYGQFSEKNNCGTTLAAGASCSIKVGFAPALGGSFTASLSVSTSPAASPSSLSLSGNAVGNYAFNGSVRADGVAVSGAQMRIYTATFGAAGPALLAVATTNSSGNYSATYDCPSAGNNLNYVYAQASGGTPAGASGANGAIRMLAGIGACTSPPTGTTVMDELTTMAFAYAFNGFTSLPSASSAWVNVAGNQPTNGLKVASDTYASLVAASGQVSSSLVNSQLFAAQELNTLANALALCLAPSATVGSCRTFADASVAGQPVPADSLNAALEVVRNPSQVNVQNLVGDGEGTGAPYSPTLAAGNCVGGLNDWTLVEVFGWNLGSTCGGYEGTGGLLGPMGLAIDAQGNIWVVNGAAAGVPAAAGVAGVSIFNDIGTPLNSYGINTSSESNTTLWTPVRIAIGPDNNGGYFGWIVSQPAASGSILSDQGAGRVTRFELAATLANCPATSNSCTLANATAVLGNATGFAQPQGIAIDNAGNARIASVYQLGDPYVPPGVAPGVLTELTVAGGVDAPFSDPYDTNAAHGGPQYHDVGVDGAGTVWVLDGANGLLLEYDPVSGSWSNGSGFATGFDRGFGVNPGLVFTGYPYTGYPPIGNQLAIDPSGNIWVAQTSNSSGTLPAFNSTGLLAGLPNEPDLHDPIAIAIDGAGDVFVVNLQNPNNANGFACMVEISYRMQDVSYSPASIGGCGLGNYAFSSTFGIAIDQAGNLWGTSSNLSYLIKIIGAAAPTVTPLSAAPK